MTTDPPTDTESAAFAAAVFGKRQQPADEREFAQFLFGGEPHADPDETSPEASEADTLAGNYVPREGQLTARPTDTSTKQFVRDLFNTNP